MLLINPGIFLWVSGLNLGWSASQLSVLCTQTHLWCHRRHSCAMYTHAYTRTHTEVHLLFCPARGLTFIGSSAFFYSRGARSSLIKFNLSTISDKRSWLHPSHFSWPLISCCNTTGLMPFLTSRLSYLPPHKTYFIYRTPFSLFYPFPCVWSVSYSSNHTTLGGQLNLNIMLSDSGAKDINTTHHNSLLFNNHYMLYFIH